MIRVYVKKSKHRKIKSVKLLGLCFIIIAIFFSLYFFFPVISYQLFIAGQFTDNQIESPVPKRLVVSSNNSLSSLIAQGVTSITSDFTDARNWYPSLPKAEASEGDKPSVATYSLSIPKLEIKDAEVSTVDYDLDEHLVQYLGTSLPGEAGTAVIFGHSTLPYLFKPGDYKTIFANIHKLEVGDEIFINVDGSGYKYKIFSILITDPDDTNILVQSYDNSYLTLVTCTPPGTIWKRLVLRASLEPRAN